MTRRGRPRAGPSGRRRRGAAAVGAVVAFLTVAAASGLLTGSPLGAADNGDGRRLFCGAGLAPATPDGAAAWLGGVVLDFHAGVAPCADPIPSSALPVLRAAASAAGPTWSLTALGWTYAGLFGLVTAVAAGVAAGRGVAGAALLVAPLAPLGQPDFARFVLSTFSEPAGLLGAYTACAGLAAILATRRADPARAVAVVLLLAGGAVAATAKPAYAPILVAAMLVVVGTGIGHRRLGGLLAVIAAAAAVAWPLAAAAGWQARHVAAINTHNLVFTLVIPEVGPGAAAELGLPPGASAAAGFAYYGERGSEHAPGADRIRADPSAVRAAALTVLAAEPAALARAVTLALTATRGRDLGYLPARSWTPATARPRLGASVGEQGAQATQLRAWLAGLTVPWWPGLLAAVGCAAGVGTSLRRRGPPVDRAGTSFARTAAGLAGYSAAAAVGVCVVAVLGDGYFEIAKHVWLAAYLLDVTAVALALAAATLRPRRRRTVSRCAPSPRRSRSGRSSPTCR